MKGFGALITLLSSINIHQTFFEARKEMTRLRTRNEISSIFLCVKFWVSFFRAEGL